MIDTSLCESETSRGRCLSTINGIRNRLELIVNDEKSLDNEAEIRDVMAIAIHEVVCQLPDNCDVGRVIAALDKFEEAISILINAAFIGKLNTNES